MVIKWIKAFLEHPCRILKSIWYNITRQNDKLASKRMEICNSCEHKMTIKYVGDICSICGCILENKTRLINEKCDLGKW